MGVAAAPAAASCRCLGPTVETPRALEATHLGSTAASCLCMSSTLMDAALAAATATARQRRACESLIVFVLAS
jgi:hypothetical protein